MSKVIDIFKRKSSKKEIGANASRGHPFRFLAKEAKAKSPSNSPSVSNDDSQKKKASSLGSYGLFVLYQPDNNDGSQITVDIVAVHGLLDGPFDAWQRDGKFWLRDREFLPSAVPSARIMTYGYNSSVALSQSVAGVGDFAETLLNYLEQERQGESERRRPIVFICHSLGGIVVKKALIIAHQASPLYYGDVLESVKGIAFMGVPHRGAGIARLGSFFAGILKASSLGLATNKSLVTTLEKTSEPLMQISQEAIHRLAGLQIYSFYETERLHGLIIVDKDSARLNLPNEKVFPVGSNHSMICKFATAEDNSYKYVSRAIGSLAAIASSNRRANARSGKLEFSSLLENSQPVPGSIAVQTPEFNTRFQTKAHQEKLSADRPQTLSPLEQEVMRCIYLIDPQQAKGRVPAAVHETCAWITVHPTLQNWQRAFQPPILWLKGRAGVGKSVLTSFIIDDMSQRYPVYYFFVDDKIGNQNNALAVLRSLTHQILEAHWPLIKKATPYYETRGTTFVEELASLWKIFTSCLQDPLSGNPCIIIDALDECEMEGCTWLLKNIELFLRTSRSSTRFFLTSRPHNQIFDILRDSSTILDLDSRDKLVVDGLDYAIRNVIEHDIERMPGLCSLPENHKQLLRVRLTSQADKTFLWVSLVLQTLPRDISMSTSSFEEALNSLPAKLYKVYFSMLNKIPREDLGLAIRIFRTLLVASEPLSLVQLNECLAIEKFVIGTYPKRIPLREFRRQLLIDTARTITGVCGSFVRITGKNCFFVHQSAKDFLRDIGGSYKSEMVDLLRQVNEQLNPVPGLAHCKMAMNCIFFTHLATFEPPEPINKWDRYDPAVVAPGIVRMNLDERARLLSKHCAQYPFLSYAIKWWAHHVRLAEEVSSFPAFHDALRQMHDLVRFTYEYNFLLRGAWLRKTIRLVNKATDFKATLGASSAIGFCAYNGHTISMNSFLTRNSAVINWTIDIVGFAPLHAAVIGKRLEMVKLLIDCGADLGSRDSWERTPLHIAARRNHLAILYALLKGGADVNVIDAFGLTPLDRARETGLEDHYQMMCLFQNPLVQGIGASKPEIDFLCPGCRTMTFQDFERGVQNLMDGLTCQHCGIRMLYRMNSMHSQSLKWCGDDPVPLAGVSGRNSPKSAEIHSISASSDERRSASLGSHHGSRASSVRSRGSSAVSLRRKSRRRYSDSSIRYHALKEKRSSALSARRSSTDIKVRQNSISYRSPSMDENRPSPRRRNTHIEK